MPAIVDKFFYNAPLPFHSLDQSGMIVHVNDAWLNMLGYTKESEVKERWFGDFIDVGDRVFFAKAFERFWRDGSIHAAELTLKHKDGHLVPVRIEGLIYKDENSGIERTQCIVQDISREKKHQEVYKSIFENSSTAYAIYEAVDDGENFRFVDFSPMGEKIDKTKRADVIGRLVTECFPGVLNSPLFEAFKRVYRSGIPEEVGAFYYVDPSKNGYRTNKVFKLSTGEIVANYYDSTELEVSKKTLESIFNLDRNIICTTLYGKEVVSCNRAFLDFFGVAELNEFKKAHHCICDMFIEDKTRGYIGKEVEGKIWVEYVAGHQDRSLIKTKISHNGHDIIFSLFAKPLKIDDKNRYLVILNDITLHENYQDELRAQVETKTAEVKQWLQTFDYAEKLSEIGVVKMDSLTKKNECSKGVHRILQDLTDCNNVKEYLIAHLHEDDIKDIKKRINALAESPKPYEIEYRIKNNKGEVQYLSITGGPTDGGRSVISVIKDITFRKEAEQLQQEHEKAIFKQHKLNALKEMFRLIAHHWRQPLTTLSLYVSNMSEYASKEHEEKAQGAYEHIMKELNFLSKTINQFTELAREEPRIGEFEIKNTLENELLLFSADLNENDIVTSVEGDEVEYNGYKFEFMRIIHALISNAKESILSKRKKAENCEGRIDFRVDKAGKNVKISVRDNGVGMTDEVLEHAFEPYFSTKFHSRGIGLSLSICQDDIENLFKGEMHINNHLDEGVEVIIEFPVV